MARIGEITVGQRRAEQVIEARHGEAEAAHGVGQAGGVGQQRRLVERRSVEVAEIDGLEAERLVIATASASVQARNDQEVRDSFMAPTVSMVPLAADRYSASSTSTACIPTGPGAALRVDRPRQRSTSTASGRSQA